MEIKDVSWHKHLGEEINKPYFQKLLLFLKTEKENGKCIYPSEEKYFRALEETPLDKVKVVIIGQDPYHGEGQADGLCFSVNQNLAIPPSLKNIFKELHTDINVPIPKSGDLTLWAKQGVLLLNTTLSVRKQQAGSHRGMGWEVFTDKVIDIINNYKQNIVFILWGNSAQSKTALINSKKHYIICSPHPSPLSAYQGFWGSKPFSRTNSYLVEKGISPIDWGLLV